MRIEFSIDFHVVGEEIACAFLQSEGIAVPVFSKSAHVLLKLATSHTAHYWQAQRQCLKQQNEERK